MQSISIFFVECNICHSIIGTPYFATVPPPGPSIPLSPFALVTNGSIGPSSTRNTHSGSIMTHLNTGVMSSLIPSPPVGTVVNHQRMDINGIQATQQQVISTSSTSTISSSSPAQFTVPPPLPQLFYWPYPSPPISPPNNFYPVLQNVPNGVLTPLLGPTQSNLGVHQSNGVLQGVVPIENLTSHNTLAHNISPNLTAQKLLKSPQIPPPAIAKALI